MWHASCLSHVAMKIVAIACACFVFFCSASINAAEATIPSLDGVAGFIEGRTQEKIRQKLNEKGRAWIAEAFVAAMENRSKETGAPFEIRDILLRGHEIRPEIQDELKRHLREWLPNEAKDLVASEILGDASEGKAREEANAIAERTINSLGDEFIAIADEIVAKWYDAAVEDLKKKIVGETAGIIDITDIKGTINRAVDLKTLGDIAAGKLSRAIGDATVSSIRGRIEDALEGRLPPEVINALQRGPREFEKFVSEAEKYLPGRALKGLENSILNRPIVKLPTAAYAAILAASAAGHYARAFRGIAVDPYELSRAVEVTRVMVWQLENKQWINLSIMQLGGLARGLARRFGVGEVFDGVIEKLKIPIKKIEDLTAQIDALAKKPIETVRRELENLVGIVEDELKLLQDNLMDPIRDGIDKAQDALDKTGQALSDKLPNGFNGIPKTWEDLKKEIGIKAPNKIPTNDKIATFPTGPSASILEEEKIPSQNQSESDALDPVLLHNGEFIHSVTDVVIPGRGLDLRFTRIYRGRSNFLGELGHRWTHSYAERLLPWNDGQDEGLTHIDERGFKFFFRLEKDVYLSPPGIYTKLVRTTDGYELRDRDGLITVFNSAGRMIEKRDRHGNSMRFLYNAQNLLSRITDAYGRSITIERRKDGLISGLRDFAGREFTYDYNTKAELIGVTSPKTPDFPQGKTTAYRYVRQPASPHQAHAISMIMDPNGYIYLRNRYDAFGRVIAQRYGDGPWMTVQYGESNDGEVSSRAWVTDALGAVRLYENDKNGHPLRLWAYEGGKYRLIESNGYRKEGELSWTCLPSGRCRSYSYGDGAARGRIVRIEEKPANGGDPRVTSIIREDRFGRPLLETDAIGNEIQFEYAENSPFDIVGVLHRERGKNWNRVTRYKYNAAGQITEEIDGRGVITKYEYFPSADPDGDGVSIVDNDNAMAGYLKKVIQDAALTSERKAYGNLMQATTTFAYDPIGNVIGVTDSGGHSSQYIVNALNQIVREERPGLATLKYRYDANDNLVAVESKESNHTFTLLREYGDLDHLVNERRRVSEGKWLERKFSYDVSGRLVGITDAQWNTTVLEYDVDGEISCIIRGANAPRQSKECVNRDMDGNITVLIDGEGARTLHVRDGFGDIVSIKDPLGNRIDFSRDVLGRIVEKKNYDAHGMLLAEMNLTYDGDGHLVKRARKLWLDNPTKSRWIEERWKYDNGGNLSSVIDALGHKTDVNYDGLGNVASIVEPSGRQLLFQNDARGLMVLRSIPGFEKQIAPVHIKYDEAGRPIEFDREDGERWQYRYSEMGDLAEIEDPQGIIRQYKRDDLGRPILVNRGRGTSHVVTKYSWDSEGRLLTVTDPKGSATNFSYDALGRLILERFADGTERQTVYDGRGDITGVIERDGTNITIVRDAAGNMISRQAIPKSEVAIGYTQRFVYDGFSRITLAIDEGEIGNVSDDIVSHFIYDSLSRPVAESIGTKWLTRFYDDNGNVAALTLPSGHVFYTAFDFAGRPLSVISEGHRIADAEYDTLGLFMHHHLGSNLNLEIAHNRQGHETSRNYLTHTDSLLLGTKTRYGSGGIPLVDIGQGKVSRSYGRDEQGRLISVEDEAENHMLRDWQFSYDASGNFSLSKGPEGKTAYSVNALNQYVEARKEQDITHLRYDINGRLTFDGKQEFGYDAWGRLSSVWKDYRKIRSYRYDAFDRLVSNETGDNDTSYVWDGWRLVERSGKEKASYAYINGIKTPVAVIDGNILQFPLTDRMGSVVGIVNENGTFQARCNYAPFGEEIYDVSIKKDAPPLGSGYLDANCTSLMSFGFSGMLSDRETHLAYARHRFLHTDLGRFLGPDPLGFKTSLRVEDNVAVIPTLSFHIGLGGASRATLPNHSLNSMALLDAFPFARLFPLSTASFGEGEVNLYTYAQNDPSIFDDPLGLSSLLFDRSEERLRLFSSSGYLLGEYHAANNVVRPRADPLRVGGRGPFPNGTYSIGVPEFYSAEYRDRVVALFEEEPFEPRLHKVNGTSWRNRPKVGDYHPSFGRIRIRAGVRGIDKADRVVSGRGLFLHGGRNNYRKKTQGCIRIDDTDVELLSLDFINAARWGDPVETITVQD